MDDNLGSMGVSRCSIPFNGRVLIFSRFFVFDFVFYFCFHNLNLFEECLSHGH